jgi:hypothetical protein
MPPPPHRHQTIKTQEDLQQDSEEEIEAVIEDELVCLCQEGERLHLMQEQQQIEQKRVAATTTIASTPKSAATVVETNTGQRRQQVPLD